MAEFVQQRVEEMMEELLELNRVGIFDLGEIG